ncbi:hypothetical protein EDD11_007834 [Mortierella claussenii]|nr:hypothetical protein EDD11_007834 [Mortierella claussenii]
MFVAGLTGAGTAGPITDKYRQYKSLCKTLVLLATLMFTGLIFTVRKGGFWWDHRRVSITGMYSIGSVTSGIGIGDRDTSVVHFDPTEQVSRQRDTEGGGDVEFHCGKCGLGEAAAEIL